MKKLSQYAKGFLEALIDGEGSIIICKEKRKDCSLGWSPYIRVTISNKDKKLLEKAKKLIGGGYILLKKDKVFELRIPPTKLKEILPQLNLTIKENKKIIALEILSIIKRGKNQYTYSQKEKDKVTKLMNSIKKS